jgi:hypothetical protein
LSSRDPHEDVDDDAPEPGDTIIWLNDDDVPVTSIEPETSAAKAAMANRSGFLLRPPEKGFVNMTDDELDDWADEAAAEVFAYEVTEDEGRTDPGGSADPPR